MTSRVQPHRRSVLTSGAALVVSVALVLAVVFGSSRPTELQVVEVGARIQPMLEMMGPREISAAALPKSRRTLALEERLNQQLQGVESLEEVDHAQLEHALRDHL